MNIYRLGFLRFAVLVGSLAVSMRLVIAIYIDACSRRKLQSYEKNLGF
jgi:hypothetical protein